MLPSQRVLSVILTGLLLGALLAGPSTSAARVKPAKPDAAAETGHIDVPDELRKVLPTGTVLYYAKVTRKLGTQTDHWVVEALDVHSGKTRPVMTDKTSGLDQLQPHSISPDRRCLLVSARQPDKTNVLVEPEIATGNWRLLRKNSFHGQYSPDGKRLVIDYQRDPKTVSVDPVLRTGIIDRNGNLLQTLPCDAKEDVSASLWVVPRQYSSGGKDDRLSRWVNRIRAERGYNKAVVAMANKMARIGWAILRNNTEYQPDYRPV